VFTERQGFAGTEFPFSLAPEIQYVPGLCPNAEAIVREVVKIPVNEFFTDEDARQTVAGIRKVADAFNRGESK
jgi:hypothetical protein